MRVGILGGLVLGLVEFAWQVGSAAAFGATSWFIPVAFGLESGVLIGLLGRTARRRTWAAQFRTGAVASLIGAILVFAGSMAVSQILFPGLLATMGPVPPTPLEAAGGGFMGTLVSGLALSAAWGFLTRQRNPPT
jgi:hypothetical protein